MQGILALSSHFSSSQAVHTFIAVVINIVWYIWLSINKLRYDSKSIPISSIHSMILANVSLAGRFSSGHMSKSMQDFNFLKFFKVVLKPSEALCIMQVDWHPPIGLWLKSNTDGAARGSPVPAAFGGIFRNSSSDAIGCFAENIGVSFTFNVELIGAMRAIEIAFARGWHMLWLEGDSLLVVQSFENLSFVPWQLRNR